MLVASQSRVRSSVVLCEWVFTSMAVLSFKSVGKTVEQKKQEANAVSGSLVPIGFKTPLRYGENSEGIFAMNFSLEEQLQDNYRNLILTNWGERVALYDFGANLRELMTEFTSEEDFNNEAIQRIANATTKWMPYVQPQTFESVVEHTENQHTAVIRIRISYDIPLLNVTGKVLEVTLYAIG